MASFEKKKVCIMYNVCGYVSIFVCLHLLRPLLFK